jgi:hypothetical protein
MLTKGVFMCTIKKFACTCATIALCLTVLAGCGEDQQKKEAQKELTSQEQLGKDAAQRIQQPLEKARMAAEQAGQQTKELIDGAATATKEAVNETAKQVDQAMENAAETAKKAGGKSGAQEKKQLEGC